MSALSHAQQVVSGPIAIRTVTVKCDFTALRDRQAVRQNAVKAATSRAAIRQPWAVRTCAMIALGAIGFLVLSCSSISLFDQAAYAQAVNLKVDTLALIDEAGGNYNSHAEDVKRTQLALLKAYEYDKNRPRNEETRQLWDTLLFKNAADPRDGILPRFFEEWKDAGSLKPAEIATYKEDVGDAFTKIIQLESGKIKQPAG